MGKTFDDTEFNKLYNELFNSQPKSELANELLKNHNDSLYKIRERQGGGGGILPTSEEVVTTEEYKNIGDENGSIYNKLGKLGDGFASTIEYRYAAYVLEHSDYKFSSQSSGSESAQGSSEGDDYKPPADVCTPINPNKITIGFDKIAGQDAVKDDMKRTYILPLRFPNLFVTKSKGVLLYGVPGGGKTLIAKAAVYELKGFSAFFAPTAGDLKGSKHGDTEKNINHLFKCAENIIGTISPIGTKYTSSIIFIDEFDGIGGLKKDDPMMTLSVNALLQKMDGITKDDAKPVSVIAATNYPWNIEEAIIRRFSSRVFVDLPDQKAREFMLLEPLHKYFIPPDETRTPLLQDGEFNVVFLDVISKLGGKYHCNRNKEGGNPDYQSINYDDIVDFAQKLGPSERAIKIIEQIKNKQDYSRDDLDSESEDVDFGRSGSDISKIMDIAIQEAASRALTSGYFQRVNIKDEDKIIDYYYVSIPNEYIEVYTEQVKTTDWKGSTQIVEEQKTRKRKVGQREYKKSKKGKLELVSTKSPPLTMYVVDEDKLVKGSEEYMLIQKDEYDKIYNFSICHSDIEFAINQYSSTINPKNYIDLLRYKYMQKYPNE